MKIGVVQFFEMVNIFDRNMELVKQGHVRYPAVQNDIFIVSV